MNKSEQEYVVYWQKFVGNESLRIDLKKLKDTVHNVFRNESDNYKQKLVYNLLETVKNHDQSRFFYILLKTINKPKEENFKELWDMLKGSYDVMPREAFINFAYSIIIGIMATYGGKENE
jgi:hypothetical protein